MRNEVHTFAKTILRYWGWYRWTDPIRQTTVRRQTPHGPVESTWSPAYREGDFIQHEIDIEHGSMEYRGNEQLAGSLVESVNAIMATMTLPSSRPVVFNHPRFAEMLGDLRNQPQLAELVGFAPDKANISPGVKVNAPLAQEDESGGVATSGEDDMVQRLMQADVQSA